MEHVQKKSHIWSMKITVSVPHASCKFATIQNLPDYETYRINNFFSKHIS